MIYSTTHTVYKNNDNKEIPSVTTILKILNKPALIKWANYLGYKRQSVDAVLEDTSYIGTTVHCALTAFLQNKQFILINGRSCGKTLLKSYLNSFFDWYKKHEIKTEFMEKKFISEKFGGTIDFYGKIDSKYTILDFKTSKSIYSSMFLQLAAYCIMLEEHGHKVEQVILLGVNENKYNEKILTRKELQKYIDTFKLLTDVFHKWFDINIEDGWGTIL